jgi:hypothetical protein
MLTPARPPVLPRRASRGHVALAVGIALAIGAVLGRALPVTAAAQGAQGDVPGRYQLVLLPGDGQQWLVLETHTGAVQRWRATATSYVVERVERGRPAGLAFQRDVIERKTP